ncbi:MAG: hypothetical protein OEV42_08505, partial [Deltaproteobacteria bacterium]|nr:hypothetical protein [Deltaproteobacteria bacterium]
IKEEYPGKARRKDSITTFIDSILNKKIEPMVTDTDVFNVMSICYAAEKSITTNETTQVEYI